MSEANTASTSLKVKFPTFDGSSDPRLWLRKCELFFELQDTVEYDKVPMAAFHLEGEALLWYMVLARFVWYLWWDEFSSSCSARFGTAFRSSEVGEVTELRQTGTVTEYRRRFEQSCVQSGAPTREKVVEIFINGLKEEIAVRVKSRSSGNCLRSAMDLASRFECS